MGKHMGSALPEPLTQALAFAVSFLTTTAMFAPLFKWMPDADVDWQDVILGAVGTATLFETGKLVISFYIGKQGLDSTYGASASIVVVLIWVYYSAQILLFRRGIWHPAYFRRGAYARARQARKGLGAFRQSLCAQNKNCRSIWPSKSACNESAAASLSPHREGSRKCREGT